MTSPVVVDGRLTREKLDELRALAAEHAELDFKSTLNFTDTPHRLGLLKDLIAMSNSGRGGYIVIGANEDGTPATDQTPVRVEQFDSADLGQAMARHVVTVPVITSQRHTVDGWGMVLIHVAPPADRLPILISTPGEYAVSPNKMKVVLQPGVLYVREGTRTVTADASHWPALLEGYRRGVVADAREDLDILVRRVVESMGEVTGGVRLAPLVLEMDEQTFAEAVDPHFDSPEGERRLRQFIRVASAEASLVNDHEGTRNNALTKLSIVAVQALSADAHSTFKTVIETLHEGYEEAAENHATPPGARVLYWLEVTLHVLVIGAALVRERAWWAAVTLTNHRGSSYYPIWIRHALVEASRAGLLSGDSREDALMLVRARALAVDHPALRPDMRKAAPAISDADFLTTDKLLNSLCQFDFLWCVIARLTHDDERDSQLFFPSCSALLQDRTQPLIDQLAISSDMRRDLLADAADDEWAAALKVVLDVAVEQSHHSQSWWDGSDHHEQVEAFLTSHLG